MTADRTDKQKAVAALSAALKLARQYLRDDAAASYALPQEVAVTLKSPALAEPFSPPCASFTTRDGSFSIHWLGEDCVRLVAHPFPSSANLWNGPDVIPNKWFRSMLASLFHDLIWVHAEELGAGTRLMSGKGAMQWGNAVLYLLWMWGSEGSWWGRREAWLAYQACSFAVPWYRAAKRALRLCVPIAAAALLFLAGCSGGGCYTPPKGAVVSVEGAGVIRSVMREQGDGLQHQAPPDGSR